MGPRFAGGSYCCYYGFIRYPTQGPTYWGDQRICFFTITTLIQTDQGSCHRRRILNCRISLRRSQYAYRPGFLGPATATAVFSLPTKHTQVHLFWELLAGNRAAYKTGTTQHASRKGLAVLVWQQFGLIRGWLGGRPATAWIAKRTVC